MAIKIKNDLNTLVEELNIESVFAHRDFHSRNMYLRSGRICLIDFQDSLVANEYYDIASLLNDSYLDFPFKKRFIDKFTSETGYFDNDQFNMVALQRNLKALGTFGYQVFVKKNYSFKKYIGRTVRHVITNPSLQRYPEIKKLFTENQKEFIKR